MKVKLKSNYKDPTGSIYDLNIGKEYEVIGIEADDYRILGEKGEPYLYSKECFDIIDKTEPCDWVTKYGEGGERYSYPQPLNRKYFFEDYFDGNTDTVMEFRKYIKDKAQNTKYNNSN